MTRAETHEQDQTETTHGGGLALAALGAVVFAAGYVTPAALALHGTLFAGVQALAAVASFVLLAVAIYRVLEARADNATPEPYRAEKAAVRPASAVVYEEVVTAPSVAHARPKQWSRELLHKVDWKCMLDLCKVFFEDRFRSQFGTLGDDGSVQIHLFKPDDDKPAAVVHCRVWGQPEVDLAGVERLIQAMAAERLSKGFFIAYGGFSEEAKALAKAQGITLIDETMFFSMLNRLPEARKQALQAKLFEEDYATPSCPVCGLKMMVRQSQEGHHWGCRAYPRCKGVLSARPERRV